MMPEAAQASAYPGAESLGPTPGRLHAVRKQWLISLVAHGTMCHHANTKQPQGPGSLNGLHSTRINPESQLWLLSLQPLRDAKGDTKLKQFVFSTFVRANRAQEKQRSSDNCPLLSSKVSLTLCSSLRGWGWEWCVPAFQAAGRIESKKMAWSMETSGRRPKQKATWAGKEGRAL